MDSQTFNARPRAHAKSTRRITGPRWSKIHDTRDIERKWPHWSHPMVNAGTGLTCVLARQATMEGISVSVIHHVLLEHIPKPLHASVLAKLLKIASNTFTGKICREVALARKHEKRNTAHDVWDGWWFSHSLSNAWEKSSTGNFISLFQKIQPFRLVSQVCSSPAYTHQKTYLACTQMHVYAEAISICCNYLCVQVCVYVCMRVCVDACMCMNLLQANSS